MELSHAPGRRTNEVDTFAEAQLANLYFFLSIRCNERSYTSVLVLTPPAISKPARNDEGSRRTPLIIEVC